MSAYSFLRLAKSSHFYLLSTFTGSNLQDVNTGKGVSVIKPIALPERGPVTGEASSHGKSCLSARQSVGSLQQAFGVFERDSGRFSFLLIRALEQPGAFLFRLFLAKDSAKHDRPRPYHSSNVTTMARNPFWGCRSRSGSQRKDRRAPYVKHQLLCLCLDVRLGGVMLMGNIGEPCRSETRIYRFRPVQRRGRAAEPFSSTIRWPLEKGRHENCHNMIP